MAAGVSSTVIELFIFMLALQQLAFVLFFLLFIRFDLYGILGGWSLAVGQAIFFDNFWMGVAAKLVGGG